MSIERLVMLTPKGVDMFSAGRSTVKGMTAADISACMVDCTPIQEVILLTKSDCLTPNEKQLKSLHIRVCQMMVKRNWQISKKDSNRKALLLLTRLCFHTYCSNQIITTGGKAVFMEVSRSQWHKRWANRFNGVMDDFNNYLAEEERDGIRAFWRRAREISCLD